MEMNRLAGNAVVERLKSAEAFMWLNPHKSLCNDYPTIGDFSQEEVHEASRRLQRFAPFIMSAFPETAESYGIIESDMVEVPRFAQRFNDLIPIQMFIKLDSHLPISGSIKARGGIHEVLCHAEGLALEAGMMTIEDDYSCFKSPRFQSFLSQYTIQVGSTGNLGLSIGIMSAALGFKVVVHMSSDAKTWKKEMLRSKGVVVVEYEQDYGVAVEKGRAQSALDPKSYFVDDEHSTRLFAGYAVAGERLKAQFERQGVEIGPKRKLFVYLPCGVGGGPGGVAYGIKHHFGEHAHVFFAEPTESPCMLLAMATGTGDLYSVQDIGLSNRTVADGLAVGRASALVAGLMENRLDGVATVKDDTLLSWLKTLWHSEGIKLEPSALAGLSPLLLLHEQLCAEGAVSGIALEDFKNGLHLLWATGGSMVPEKDFSQWLNL